MKILILLAALFSGTAHAEPLRCELLHYFPDINNAEVDSFDATIVVNADLSGTVNVPQASLSLQDTVSREPDRYSEGENPMVDAAIESLELAGKVASVERIHFLNANGDTEAALLRLLGSDGGELDTFAFIANAMGMGSCKKHALVLYGDPSFNRF